MLTRILLQRGRLSSHFAGKKTVNNHAFYPQLHLIFRRSSPLRTKQLSTIRQESSQTLQLPIRESVERILPTWSAPFRRLAKIVKYARIPFLMVTVYALGRQQGIMECSRNPRLVEDELLRTIFADVGVTNRGQVKTFTSEDQPVLALTALDQLQAKTVRIGNDIIRVASLYVRGEIVNAIKKIREKVPSDISNEEFMKLCHANEEFEFWTTSLFRVEGEDPTVPWKYVLIDSPIANAFVSEILPQRFFITTAMFTNYISNEDELAVVLGHEMSHLILGHASQRNTMETMLRTIEVLLLSVDPTEGVVSLGVIGGLSWMRGAVMASFSRENETEADTLGIKLAAMACYDTKKGGTVMQKMHDHQVRLAGKPSSNSHRLQLMDTHPPSLARYKKIQQESETENPLKYDEACASVHRRLMQSIWGK